MMPPRKVPKASWRESSKSWEAKGVDPETGKRKSYYSKVSAEDASRIADESFGVQVPIETLHGFYVSSYLPSRKRKSANWRQQIAWAYDGHIGPRWGHVPLKELTRKDLQAWVNDVDTIGANSLQKVKIVFSGILNLAVLDGEIESNPLSLVRIEAAPTREIHVPEFEDLARLLLAATPRERRPIVLMMFGLRIGEVCGAMRSHLIGSGSVLDVQMQTIQVKGGAVHTDKLKTPQSRRPVPLPAGALAMLSFNEEERPSLFLAPNGEGGMHLPNNAHRDLDAAIARAGIRRVRPHELRHTFVSIMENELEAPRPIVEELVGKSKGDRLGIYSHARLRQKAKWTARYWGEIESAMEALGQSSTSATTT